MQLSFTVDSQWPRCDVDDRAGATAAAVSDKHATGQARSDRADPVFAAVKSPGGIEPAGAYKANPAVRLVSPPVELVD
jgi:hypothetical protein